MDPATSNTLLSYNLQTLPDPLQASPAQGDTVYGALSFVISNSGTTIVEVSQLQITLSVGDLAQNLAATAGGILWSTSPLALWNITSTSPGVFLFVPASGQPVPVSTDGMVIQLYNIPINQQVGTTPVAVLETATGTGAPSQVRTATFNLAKFPYGFYFGKFTAQVPMVADGGTVTLTWQGSNNATYTLQSSTAPGIDVSNVRNWQSPPLKTATTFLLRATVVSQGETVTTDLTTTVIVADPELQATSIVVTGVATLQGATTLGSTANATTVAGALTANGATRFNGTTMLSGTTTAGALNVNGGLTSGGATTLNGTTINADVQLNGVLIGNSWIGGNAARIRGYGTASTAVFAFKYDNRNFGDKPTAIQIWNESSGVFKTFVIDHPVDPELYLIHATLEGPEGAVFYRGSAQLEAGEAIVTLPPYFEAFTDPASVTILLTAVDGFDPLSLRTQGARKVVDGRFRVVSNIPGSTQRFDWEVKATRADQPALQVEQPRADVRRRGDGPYTYVTARSRWTERSAEQWLRSDATPASA